MPPVASPRVTSAIARRGPLALAQPFGLQGHELRITASIGIAFCPEHGVEPEPLIEHADIALYQAKARGRARVEIFAESMKADLPARAP